jgi:uncharacterized protein (TIGR00369 family)
MKHKLNSNEIIQQYISSNNFGEFLEIHFEILKNGEVNYFGSIEKKFLATPSAVHGGLIATLCDGALGIAALSTVVEDNKVVATIEMNVKYLKPAFEGDQIIAHAKVISAGKRIIVSNCEVKNQNNVLIAIASGTFNAYPKEKAGY